MDRSHLADGERGHRNVSLVNLELIAIGFDLTLPRGCSHAFDRRLGSHYEQGVSRVLSLNDKQIAWVGCEDLSKRPVGARLRFPHSRNFTEHTLTHSALGSSGDGIRHNTQFPQLRRYSIGFRSMIRWGRKRGPRDYRRR